jgi:hypothetical protein
MQKAPAHLMAGVLPVTLNAFGSLKRPQSQADIIALNARRVESRMPRMDIISRHTPWPVDGQVKQRVGAQIV